MKNKSYVMMMVLISTILIVSCGSLRKKLGLSGKDNPEDKPSEPVATKQPSPFKLTGHLQSFKNCQEADSYLKEKIIEQFKINLDNEIEYIKNDKNRSIVTASNSSAPVDDAAQSNDVASGAASKSAPSDFTTTNNQVAGVDEADALKNNGTHIFQVAVGALNILESWPAESMKLIASVKFDGQPISILLTDNNKVVVFSRPKVTTTDDKYNYYEYHTTEVIVVDVADPSNPKTEQTFKLDGSFVTARKINSSIKIILNSYLRYPDLENMYYYEEYSHKSTEDKIAHVTNIFEKNVTKIREHSLEQWINLENNQKIETDGTSTPLFSEETCENMYSPTTSSPLGLTSVITMNVNTNSVKSTMLFSYINNVYASATSLYLATPYYWWDGRSVDGDFTFIHAFDISDESESFYFGSGGVEGTPLNQFSMDEYQGNLRVATTVAKYTRDDDDEPFWWPRRTIVGSRITALEPEDNTLKVIGATSDIAPNESIQSVRFNGRYGFLVTFLRTDPLFTIDLADPTDPKILGELKIPGFSTYIHLMDEEHLLTVGYDADPTTGRSLSPKITIFDVSDMTSPKEQQIYNLPASTWTQADSWDHHAFTYFASKKLLGLPIVDYKNEADHDGYKSSLMVFKTDPTEGITLVGNLDMSDIKIDRKTDWGWYSNAAVVNRSIFADDFVYAVSHLGVKAAKVSDLDHPVSKVKYECNDSCFNSWYWFDY